MKRPRWRVVRWVLLGGVVATCLAAWAVLWTEPGLQLVWRFVEPRLPATLRVGEVRGRLVGPVELSDVRFLSESADVRVADLAVDWNLRGLPARRLDIRTLTVEGVSVTLPQTDTTSASATVEPGPLPPFSTPLAVTIGTASAHDIQLLGRDGLPRLDSLSLEGVAIGDAVTWRALVVSADIGRVEASATIRPRGEYPFSARIDYDVSASERRFTGGLDMSGTADSVAFSAEVASPVGARGTGIVLRPRTSPWLEADVELDSTAITAIVPDGPDGAVRGRAHLVGTVDSLAAAGDGLGTGLPLGDVAVDFDVTRQGMDVGVRNATARVAGATLSASGRVVLGEAPSADLTLDWADLRWPLDEEPRFESPDGTATFSGSRSAYHIRVEGPLRQVGGQEGLIQMEGDGTAESLTMRRAQVDALGGRITASGGVGWDPTPRWRLDFEARDVSTAGLLPDSSQWHGSASFRGRVRGGLAREVVDLDFTVDTLSGQLGSAPLEGSTSGTMSIPLPESGPQWDRSALDLRWIELLWGANSLFASGSVADSVRAWVSLSAPDIEGVLPRAGGSVDARVQFRGARARPDLEIDLTADRMRWDSLTIERLAVGGVAESHVAGAVDLELSGEGVTFGPRALDSVRAIVRGSVEDHRIDAVLQAPEGSVVLRADGAVEEQSWSGTLGALTWAGPIGRWGLVDPTDVFLSPDSATLGRGCWTSDATVACAEGRWSAEGSTSVVARVDSLDARRFEQSLPPGWAWEGVVDLGLDVQLTAEGELTAEASADLSAGRLTFPASAGPRTLTYQPTRWEGAVGENGATSSLALALTNAAGREVILVDGDIALPGYHNITDSLPPQEIGGTLRTHIDDFGALEGASAGVEAIEGVLDADVEIGGSVRRPVLLGEARFRDGRASIPVLGLELDSLELTARGQGNAGVVVEGRAVSERPLTLQGHVPVSPTAADPARITLTGQRVRAVALPEVDVWVSPRLELAASPERLAVSGEVTVPVARVELSQVPTSAVRPSPDVVFVGDSTQEQRRIPVGLDVRLVLGDSVYFDGSGVSARPTGALVVRDGSADQPVATGEITLNDGRYRFYGQELTIDRGRILFAGGPLDNPGLDIRATRTAQDGVVAGLQTTGSLRQPEVTIFSEPAMLESEAFAYIVLGHPLGEASVSEGSLVASAATSIGLKEGNALASRIGQRFGLADVRVEADGPLEEASLIAGKYLSPRLYVSYGVGLFDPISTFRLRYLLSGAWTLLAESGESAGLDLMYRIERGR